MNWSNLLPPGIAQKQETYARRHRVRVAHLAGATQAQIARSMGLSPSSVQHMLRKANVDIQHNRRSPAESYLVPYAQDRASLTPQEFRERLYEVKARSQGWLWITDEPPPGALVDEPVNIPRPPKPVDRSRPLPGWPNPYWDEEHNCLMAWDGGTSSYWRLLDGLPGSNGNLK
jgi:hypothetical protein